MYEREPEPDQIDMMGKNELIIEFREIVERLEEADKKIEGKNRQISLLKEKVADSESLVVELEANKKVFTKLRDFDLNRLLGEAALETMLTNSKLSVQLDVVRGEVKRLLNQEDRE